MSTRTVKISFDALMDLIENHIEKEGFIKPSEFLVYADIGVPIDDDGNVLIEVEIEDIMDYEEADLLLQNENNIVRLKN